MVDECKPVGVRLAHFETGDCLKAEDIVSAIGNNR